MTFLLNSYRFGAAAPSPGDPDYSSVSFLIDAEDGSAGNADYTDRGPNSLSFVIASIPAATASALSGSLGLNCAGNQTINLGTVSTADCDFGTADFTIECRLRTTATSPSTRYVFTNSLGGVGRFNFGMGGSPGNYTAIFIADTGGTLVFEGTTSLNDGNTHFLSLTRSGDNLYIHVDGTLEKTQTGVAAVSFCTTGNAIISNNWSGDLDDIRVTNGVARYGAANYSVPSGPFPTS